MLSFTYGEKIESTNGTTTPKQSTNSDVETVAESNSTNSEKKSDNPEYIVKGKDWFYVPDYAGEAASAVKLQILQIIDK